MLFRRNLTSFCVNDLNGAIQNQGGKMVLNAKSWLFLSIVLVTGTASATSQYDAEYLTVKRKVIKELPVIPLEMEKSNVISVQDYNINGLDQVGNPDPIANTGKIIGVARDLIALGEDIYKLVIKGKPSNTTKYAPLSVVPKAANGEPVDIMETENWQMPKKRTFEILYENLYGMDVVKFRYSVIYSYGGSYDGRGAYLTAVQIIPESVSTLFGYDFTATMKLGGVQNMGTRIDPVAGATVLLEYTVSTVLKANNEVDTFFVTGEGGFKAY